MIIGKFYIHYIFPCQKHPKVIKFHLSDSSRYSLLASPTRRSLIITIEKFLVTTTTGKMRWFKRSTESPKLLSLSPLRQSELGGHHPADHDPGATVPELGSTDPVGQQPVPLVDLFGASSSGSSSGSGSYTTSCSSPSASTSSPSTSTTFSYTSDCGGGAGSLAGSCHKNGKALVSAGAVASQGSSGVTPRKSRIGMFLGFFICVLFLFGALINGEIYLGCVK